MKSQAVPGRRHAFTLIELLVSTSVVALLLAILLPAVQGSRGAARRADCADRMRQVALAVQNFESRTGALPFQGASGLSAFAQLMGEIERPREAELYARIADSDTKTGRVYSDRESVSRLTSTPVRLLKCPDDPNSGPGDAFGSMRLCRGLNYMYSGGTIEQRADTRGAFGVALHPTRLADITDGLSQTALLSEAHSGTRKTALGSATSAAGPINVVPWSPGTTYRDDYVRAACGRTGELDSLRGDVFGISERSSLYNHGAPPNATQCDVGFFLPAGLFNPTSMHPGGVNLANADGAVTFVSDAVDQAAWRARATIAGNELP